MNTNPFFPEIKGKLAFGCMRLPMKGDGLCPMEKAVENVSGPDEAVIKIEAALEKLK